MSMLARIRDGLLLVWPPAWLATRWRLRRLKVDLWKLKLIYSRQREQARRKGARSAEFEEIRREELLDVAGIEEEIAHIESALLIATARGLDLIVQSVWEDGSFTGLRSLTQDSALEVRRAIRAERQARWSAWEVRARTFGPVLGGLSGLIGTVIGLVAISRR